MELLQCKNVSNNPETDIYGVKYKNGVRKKCVASIKHIYCSQVPRSNHLHNNQNKTSEKLYEVQALLINVSLETLASRKLVNIKF